MNRGPPCLVYRESAIFNIESVAWKTMVVNVSILSLDAWPFGPIATTVISCEEQRYQLDKADQSDPSGVSLLAYVVEKTLSFFSFAVEPSSAVSSSSIGSSSSSAPSFISVFSFASSVVSGTRVTQASKVVAGQAAPADTNDVATSDQSRPSHLEEESDQEIVNDEDDEDIDDQEQDEDDD